MPTYYIENCLHCLWLDMRSRTVLMGRLNFVELHWAVRAEMHGIEMLYIIQLYLNIKGSIICIIWGILEMEPIGVIAITSELELPIVTTQKVRGKEWMIQSLT